MTSCGRIRFGPAGKPIDLKGDILKAPEYLRELGLDAMEYEAVRGVKISKEKAIKLGQLAAENNVLLSLHAPYFINLASTEDSKFKASIDRVVESLLASEWMGSYVVVIHVGYYPKGASKSEAVKKVIEGLREAWEQATSKGVRKTWLSPETTGRTSQIGTVEEVIEICSSLDKCKPTIDWAHLYARSMGEFPRTIDDVIKVVEKIEKEIGKEAVDPLHTHFSKIEFGKGGEKRHHTLDKELFGPDFNIVCQAYKETGVDATIISESPILEKDALVMKSICAKVCKWEE